MADRVHNAVITGAGSGLGRALSLRLARDRMPWNVAIADVDMAAAQETLALVEAAGGRGRVEKLDVASIESWNHLRERLRADWDRIDLVANNAGVCGAGELGECDLSTWDWMLDVNLRGVIHGCHAFIGWMKENPDGAHFINTASLAGLCYAPTLGAYNVTKAGVVALSETLYVELKKYGIGVTVVCPAFFQTNLVARGRFVNERQREVGENSMRKAGFTADDVADAAIRAMHRKQFYVILPLKGRIYWRLKRFIPRTFLRVLARRYQTGLPDSI